MLRERPVLRARSVRRIKRRPGTAFIEIDFVTPFGQVGPSFGAKAWSATISCTYPILLYKSRAKSLSTKNRRRLHIHDGCLDLLGPVGSLHDIQVRLTAWLTQRYHKRPHASLVGRSPAQLWAERRVRKRVDDELGEALTVRERRRVRGDATMPVGGDD